MIEYDRSLPKSLMVSPTAWTASPLFRWLDNFSIITNGDDKKMGNLYSTYGVGKFLEATEETPKTVKAIYESPALRRTLEVNGLIDDLHILNRTPRDRIIDYPYASNPYNIVEAYENKASFRRVFSGDVRFPEYEIIDIALAKDPSTYSALVKSISTELIVQHPAQSGGRGTYFVSSEEDFYNAVAEIENDTKETKNEIIVSRAITNFTERSLQVCILADDILIGPPQAQLLRNPLLVHRALDAIQFCGGRIDASLMSDQEYQEAREYAKTIAQELQRAGYRGIFGIDYLISDAVYVIEANLRFTGLSALLASLQQESPYMLLHVLELDKKPYVLHNKNEVLGSGSFITVYAQHDCWSDVETGLYDVNLHRLGDGFSGANLLPELSDTFFVATRTKVGEFAKAGKSIAFIYSKNALFDNNGNLSTDAEEIVKNIRARMRKV